MREVGQMLAESEAIVLIPMMLMRMRLREERKMMRRKLLEFCFVRHVQCQLEMEQTEF